MGELYGQHYHGDTNVKTVYNNNKKVPFFHFFVFVFVFCCCCFSCIVWVTGVLHSTQLQSNVHS